MKTKELIAWLKSLRGDLKTAGWDDELDEQAHQEIVQRLMEFDELKSVIHDTVDTAIELYSLLFALTGQNE